MRFSQNCFIVVTICHNHIPPLLDVIILNLLRKYTVLPFRSNDKPTAAVETGVSHDGPSLG